MNDNQRKVYETIAKSASLFSPHSKIGAEHGPTHLKDPVPVLDGARLAFIGVADDVTLGVGRRAAACQFAGGRKSGAAPAADPHARPKRRHAARAVGETAGLSA
jgi:hypothetical protein